MNRLSPAPWWSERTRQAWVEPAGMAAPRHRPWRRIRWHSVQCALQGLLDAWRTQPHLRLHVYVGGSVMVGGLWLHLSPTEWIWVSFAIGLVIFAEMTNTAIEQTVDLVVGLRPDPLARQIKDIAAGCVLVAAVLAIVIGALTFGPHVLKG